VQIHLGLDRLGAEFFDFRLQGVDRFHIFGAKFRRLDSN
jgi:hypothetical protein